jgi:uncharacterized protein (DUF924 family)
MADTASIRDILDFWFLPLGGPGYGAKRELWWKSTPELDAGIGQRFGAVSDRAVAGAFDHWAKSPDGALALIVLCDQFPRNMRRHTVHAFAGDEKALAIARIALAHGYPLLFAIPIRMFFYMPFGHSEALADQELACTLFATLEDEESMKAALEHRDVVARFGRFPHRNEVLGRVSTAEEIEYLKQANRFGQ